MLVPLRLRMVRVALGLGWASAAVVVIGTLLPAQGRDRHPELLWGLVGLAVAVNGLMGALPWPSRVGSRWAQRLLGGWATAVALLVPVFVRLDGGERSPYFLLYFLLIPFVAATEDLCRQLPLYLVMLGGYSLAVLLGPAPEPGILLVRLLVMAADCAVSAVLASALEEAARERSRARAEAGLERLLVDEAHHRIKNTLQLVADLLALEAAREGAALDAVVERTEERIQALAAVHQSLARRTSGTVSLGEVLGQVAELLVDRSGPSRHISVGAEPVVLDGSRAAWAALVGHELMTNAMRHGCGPVEVAVKLEAAEVSLEVCDRGRGPLDGQAGLGLTLVRRLVEDGLEGSVTWGYATGPERAVATVRFPLHGAKEQHAPTHR